MLYIFTPVSICIAYCIFQLLVEKLEATIKHPSADVLALTGVYYLSNA
jgi:hypothetical protein